MTLRSPLPKPLPWKKATRRPSGDQHGSKAKPAPPANRFMAPPCAGTRQIAPW
jgi:hypothetical protein